MKLKTNIGGPSFIKRIILGSFGIIAATVLCVLAVPERTYAAATVNASEISGDDIYFDSTRFNSTNELKFLQDVTINLDEDCTFTSLILNNHTLTIKADPDHPEKKLTVASNDTSPGNIVIESGTLLVTEVNNIVPGLILDGDLIIQNGRFESTAIVDDANNISVTGNNAYVNANGLHASSSISIQNGTVISPLSTYGSNSSISITGGSVTATGSYYGIICEGSNSSITISGDNTVVTLQGTSGAIASGGTLTISTNLPDGVSIGQFTDGPSTYTGLVRNGAPVTTQVVIGRVSGTGTGASSNVSSCSHSYSWQTVTDPTADSDGMEALVCSICGNIADTKALSALGVFESETADKIRKAPKNGTVTVETRKWNSYGPTVREALKSRPDVALKVSFLSGGYKGIPLRLTIPAGSNIDSLYDNNGFMGLCNVGTKLGYDK